MTTNTEESVNNFYDNKLFKLNKKYLSILGLWPFQDYRNRMMIMSAIWIGIFTVVVPELIYFIKVFYDVKKMIDCLMALILTYAASIIYFCCFFKHKSMKEILEEFTNNWINLRNEAELNIFQRFANEGKLLIICYSIAVGLTLMTFVVIPLVPMILDKFIPLNESRPLATLLEVEYFVDHNKYYWPIYLHNLQAAAGVIFSILAVDSYFVMIVQNAISMFAVLGRRIDQLNYANAEIHRRYVGKKREALIYEKVVECMEFHRDCIRFSDRLEASFTVSFLLQIFLNMIVISITSFQTITRKNNPEQMFSYMLNTLSVTTRLFFISYSGQKLQDHSLKVYDYICNIEWLEFPTGTKKLFILMLLRSSKPCKITAGKMMPLNYKTYAKLLQTSLSYFTMILSTQ